MWNEALCGCAGSPAWFSRSYSTKPSARVGKATWKRRKPGSPEDTKQTEVLDSQGGLGLLRGTQNSSEVGLNSSGLAEMVGPCQVLSSAPYFPGVEALSPIGIWEWRLMPG